MKHGDFLTKFFTNLYKPVEIKLFLFFIIISEQLPLCSLSTGPSDTDTQIPAVKNRQGNPQMLSNQHSKLSAKKEAVLRRWFPVLLTD